MKIYSRVARKLKHMVGFNRADPVRNFNCSEFEVDNWVISDFLVRRLIPVVGIHPYPIAELNLMIAAMCRVKPQQIFEWGTNIGKSARIFYETGKHFGILTEIHSVDLPDELVHEEHPKTARGRMVKGYSGVSLYQGDGLTKSIELYKNNPEYRTLVFIDGDHSYESVRRELVGIIEAMPNAAILLHDTFYQSEQSGYNIGPYKAVTEILATMPGAYRVMATTTGLPGMTFLYKPES
jgi:cephalosporin hydroxylase